MERFEMVTFYEIDLEVLSLNSDNNNSISAIIFTFITLLKCAYQNLFNFNKCIMMPQQSSIKFIHEITILGWKTFHRDKLILIATRTGCAGAILFIFLILVIKI